ncbi:cytochrome c/c1 heme-lyase [Fusarium redolens]|uniref:Holocytochrome c-type synthase n=1 Tax=Fusarium redolens TaxID=48865 RepID=A0A9P9HE98_FUSRE|nr:cytochrome c/c1 heme-lyase [Fusarium redolens]KAH7255338.1 cytochrome c/c1 heme-lyase [Fusarium redolens]
MADKDACPVDHKSREAWLAQAREAEAAKAKAVGCPVDHTAQAQSKSWSQAFSSYLPWSSSKPTPPPTQIPSNDGLDTDRVISTIPRTSGGPAVCPVDHGKEPAKPANHEMETGVDPSGNWVYPSEKMFFDAMKRKGYDARVADMKTVVPIHNAVNERAWKEIKEWEAPYLKGTKCDGPKLESFANKMDRMTPTARFNTILGYTAPFDRHDWVIDRCGTRVDYVIDFYAGRPDGKGGPSFYLDVRPKLNTWEGVKMRAKRWAFLA